MKGVRASIYTRPEGLCGGHSTFSEEDYLPSGLVRFRGTSVLKRNLPRLHNRVGALDEKYSSRLATRQYFRAA
jgi:hypothetical protein